MDVTDQILKSHLVYGSSDFTAQFATSSSRALNYANGASIQKPELEKVTAIPYELRYQDSVGLFGAENHFIRVNLKIQNPVLACYEEPRWECAEMSEDPAGTVNYYETGLINSSLDTSVVNDYYPADLLANTGYGLTSAFAKVELENLKTGNIYVDNWFDIRLYNKARQEHAYNTMYVNIRDYFYIGFHARNTRQLPYDVKCIIGRSAPGTRDGYLNKNDVPPELLDIS